jgi:hypothetical protein
MNASATDPIALVLATAIAVLITAAFAFGDRDAGRRGWIIVAALVALLIAAGLIDLYSRSPRETHPLSVITGALVPVLGAFGLARATRRVRPWIRWPVVFVAALVLLLAGLLLGATLAPRLFS